MNYINNQKDTIDLLHDSLDYKRNIIMEYAE